MNLDPKTIDYLKRARNKPVAWSFELNTYGRSGRHIVVLSDSNKTAIAAALDTPRNGVTQTNDTAVIH